MSHPREERGAACLRVRERVGGGQVAHGLLVVHSNMDGRDIYLSPPLSKTGKKLLPARETEVQSLLDMNCMDGRLNDSVAHSLQIARSTVTEKKN